MSEINPTGSTIKLKIEPGISLDLRVEAKRRGVDRDDLAAAILQAVEL